MAVQLQTAPSVCDSPSDEKPIDVLENEVPMNRNAILLLWKRGVIEKGKSRLNAAGGLVYTFSLKRLNEIKPCLETAIMLKRDGCAEAVDDVLWVLRFIPPAEDKPADKPIYKVVNVGKEGRGKIFTLAEAMRKFKINRLRLINSKNFEQFYLYGGLLIFFELDLKVYVAKNKLTDEIDGKEWGNKRSLFALAGLKNKKRQFWSSLSNDEWVEKNGWARKKRLCEQLGNWATGQLGTPSIYGIRRRSVS